MYEGTMVFKQSDPTKCHCCDALNFGEPAPDCPDCKGTGKPPEKEPPVDVPPNTNEIRGYIHCKLCNEEEAEPQMLEIGRTPYGYQVWCRRHDCNVVHIGIKKTGEVILNGSRAARPEDGPTPGEAAVRPPPKGVQALLDKLDEVLADSWEAGKAERAPRVFMNAKTYRDLRKWRQDRLDLNTRTEMLKLGWVAMLHPPDFDPESTTTEDFTRGLPIWCSRLVPVGSIFINTSDERGPLTKAPGMLQLIRLEEAS